MKKTRFLSFLLLPLLSLASCSSSKDTTTALEQSKEIVGKISLSEKVPETYVFEGHIAQFNLVRPAKGNGGINEASPLLGEPVHISKDDYYNPTLTTDQSGTYYSIVNAMIPSTDPNAVLDFAYTNSNLVFSASGVSGKLTFRKVQLSADDAFTFGEVDVSGRFDVSLTYNREGNLVSETVKTVGNLHSDSESTVDYKLTYSYGS